MFLLAHSGMKGSSLVAFGQSCQQAQAHEVPMWHKKRRSGNTVHHVKFAAVLSGHVDIHGLDAMVT